MTGDQQPAGVNFQSPEMLALLQNRLDSLAGRPSGYIESLPLNVQVLVLRPRLILRQNRISALQNIQDEHSLLEDEFELEILKLEKLYHTKFAPFYAKRAKIVSGEYEPTAQEFSRKEKETAEEGDEAEEGKSFIVENKGPVIAEIDDSIVGIPEFWLTALKNTRYFQEEITDEDEPALRHLQDISLEYLEEGLGFKLLFKFSENEYFSDQVLTKTYQLNKPDEPGMSFMFDKAVGTEIQWKEGKNLTSKVEIKKQRHKSGQKTRTVKRTVPCESFFNFFSPQEYPEDDDSQEVDENLMESIEADYEAGEFIKEKLIPNSVGWFTGEALEYESDLSESEFEEDEDEDDEEDDDDNADGGHPQGAITGDPAANPECKQQ
ncbi:MAG: hypothetical protein SGCHY_000616 [Lobulomycetales sp.]